MAVSISAFLSINVAFREVYRIAVEMAAVLSFETLPSLVVSHNTIEVLNFRLKIHVKCTNEHFLVSEVTSSMTIGQLKNKVEKITGIPG